MNNENAATTTSLFDKRRHIRYFSYCLKQLPSAYDKLDTNRLTLVHFCVQALDVLGCVDTVDKEAILEWMERKLRVKHGYLGGTFLGDWNASTTTTSSSLSAGIPMKHPYLQPHIAMTYTALCIHLTLTGELPPSLDANAVTEHLAALQSSDGSFRCVADGSEHDMRFLYCACCISYMLNDWRGVDTSRAVRFIQSCRSFDGAIALIPGQEGHGGSTFCGVASLVLMGELENVMCTNTINLTTTQSTTTGVESECWKNALVRWCVHRQVGGMQGRPNKLEDTCYSYWIGGTLRLLGRDDLLDGAKLRAYILTCQSAQYGGFGKVLHAFPDVLHSFYSLAWLTLSSDTAAAASNTMDDDEQGAGDGLGLRKLNCTLGICQERADVFIGADGKLP